jgi:hypothetical protein
VTERTRYRPASDDAAPDARIGAFRQLPLSIKIAVWVVFNNAWWSIEASADD